MRWQALSLRSKATRSLCGAACLGLAGLIWWASQPEYRVLYAGLSAEEAGAITSKLRTKAIPFKLAAGGTTVLVPSEQAMQAHLDLTAEGVAGSAKIGKGLDFFDQPMIGATPFTQSVNFQRASRRNWPRRSCRSTRSPSRASTSCGLIRRLLSVNRNRPPPA